MTEEPRPHVLVVLGNYALNGQERGNIEVFRATAGRGLSALFVTHKAWGHTHLQPALDGLGLEWTTLPYARHFTKKLSPWGWVQNLGRIVRGSWRFRAIMRRYGPTHIHVANPHYFLCVLPALLLTRTPVVFRLGDVPTEHNVLYRTLWRRVIVPRVDRFVCVSGYIRDRLVETGCPPEKATVIYSHPAARAEPEPLVLPDVEGRTVAFVGQLAPHKGLDLFVEAALDLCRAHDDVRFLIAGAFARSNVFAIGLAGKVKASGFSGRIRFLGYVEDVPGLLAAADVHACPSVCAEALSNTVVEAKAAGTPSVVFPSGGLPELVTEQGADGWVCDTPSVDALRAGLEHFLAMGDVELDQSGRAARASMGTLGIAEAVFARQWLEVYGVKARDVIDEPTAVSV